MIHSFLLSVLIFSFFSCSQVKIKEKSKTDKKEKFQETIQNIKAIGEKLAQVRKNIKGAGEDAVNFFATGLFLKASRASIEGDYLTSVLLLEHLTLLLPEDDFLKKNMALNWFV